MNKNTTSYPNSLVIILTFLILMGTSIMDFYSTCFAQSPWTKKADMPTGRWELSTCVVDGKIYAIGGAIFLQAVRTVEVYDPATDTWSTKSDMPTARQAFSTSVVNGKIYAIGGGLLDPTFSSGKSLSIVEEYDPAIDTWTKKSDMPNKRGWHSAIVLDGKIYIIGGCNTPGGPSMGTAILAVDVYDPTTDSWSQKGNIPGRIGAGFTSLVDGKIYAFGGYGGLDKVRAYDPTTDTWIQKTDMPTGRCGLSTSFVNGKIYAIGGHPGSSPYKALAEVEAYNSLTDTWEIKSNMLIGRCGVSTSVVNGKIYAFGGYMDKWGGPMCVTVEQYDPSKDLTDVERIDSKLPKQFDLNQNYPNPFNPSTKISYSIPNSGFIILKVYNMLGREVETLVSQYQNADTYSISFNAGKLASGIYLYNLQTDAGYSEMRIMSLVK